MSDQGFEAGDSDESKITWSNPGERTRHGGCRGGPRRGPDDLVTIGLAAMAMLGVLLASPVRAAPLHQIATPAPVDAEALSVDGDPIVQLVLPGSKQHAFYVVGTRAFYRSSDGGATWQAVGPPPPAPRVAVAADDSLLLAGSRSACGRAQNKSSPLFRSRDGGATWKPVAGIGDLLPLAIWGEPELALGATCSGLQVSNDGGLTWRAAPAIPADYQVGAFAPASGEPDAPAFFVVATSEGGTSVLSIITLTAHGDVASSEQLRTFWGGGSVGGRRERPVLGTPSGVLVSSDGGQSWRLSRQGLEDVTLSVDPTTGPIPDDELRRGFGITAVAADPDLDARMYVGTVAGVYHSGDGGETWTHLEGTGGVIEGLILTPRGTLLTQTDSGVFEYVTVSAAAPSFPAGTPPAATLAIRSPLAIPTT